MRIQDPHDLKVAKKLLHTPVMSVTSTGKFFLKWEKGGNSMNLTDQAGIAYKNKTLLRTNR